MKERNLLKEIVVNILISLALLEYAYASGVSLSRKCGTLEPNACKL